MPVPVVPGGFVVNAGDLIQRWTNNVWRSNLHRVANPEHSVRSSGRLSLVFFTGPNDDTVIEPLDVCVSSDRPAAYAPVRADEHLRQKLAVSNV